MNDNDIIEALGYCFAVGDCEHCVYADKPCQELMADALDLINRQKAEIDELRKSEESAKQNAVNMARAMPNIAKATRIEAIKEFAERLNEYIDFLTSSPYTEGVVPCIKAKIEQFMKEMTEEQK